MFCFVIVFRVLFQVIYFFFFFFITKLFRCNSNFRYLNIKRQYEEGRKSGETERKEAKVLGEKSVTAINWLKKFTEDCGDKLPDSEKHLLPSCYTKLAVWQTYQADNPQDHVSLDYFCKLWLQNCPHISTSKVIE